MNAAEELRTQGYTIVKGAYSLEHISAARNACLAYFNKERTLPNANGKYLPDFIDILELAPVVALKASSPVKEAMDAYFGSTDAYRFCGHSDIGMNRVVSGWHKDILNGNYVSYQRGLDPWKPGPDGELYQILKLGIYLEDHSSDSGALQVVPGSHVRRDLETGGAIRLHPALGDAILFDQRITHRGMERQVPEPRIMISYGFGANNIFTDTFEKGTRARQADQLRGLKALSS